MSTIVFGKEVDEIIKDIDRLDIPLDKKDKLKEMVLKRPETGEELELNKKAAKEILFDQSLASKVHANDAKISTILRMPEKCLEDNSFILSLSIDERRRLLLYREILLEMERSFFEEMTEEEHWEWMKKGYLPFWRASLMTEEVLDEEGKRVPFKLFLATRTGKVIERVSGPDNTITLYFKDYKIRDKRILYFKYLRG